MSARTILVTGGAGYVGSTLVPVLLARGHTVRVLDSVAVGDGSALLQVWGHDGFEFVSGDVRDHNVRAHALRGIDAVVHLAAIVGDPACARDPELAQMVNVHGTLSLLEQSRAAGVERFVFASTCSNYGKMADGDGFATEEWELQPVSLYAETKVRAEVEVLAAASSRFASTCLRFATVYGASPRMRFDLTVNEFARDALVTGELVIYGEQFWRPYVHVRDAAHAVATVLDAPAEKVRSSVFNVGATGENFRKQDLVEFILARLPGTKVERVARTEDPRDYRVSFEKVKSTLGLEPTRTVPQGIDEILELLQSGVIADPFDARYRN